MSAEIFDVTVIGNVGIDTNVYLAGDEVDFSVEANFTQNLDVVGQAGGYACRGYASLGAATAFIGHVGADYSGEYIRRVFEQDNINTEGVFVDPAGTSRSINFMYRSGQRKNFYDGKSHMTLHPPLEKAGQILSKTRMAHFNIPNWARKLLPIAKEQGVIIACDIQDVTAVDDPYRLDFITAADYLFFSAANHADPTSIIRAYLQMNPDLVIVSGMGARGCALGNAQGIRFFQAVDMDLPVVDTNGAGDALATGFLISRVLEGRSLEESIHRGQICARYKCAQRATSSSMITKDLLNHYAQSSQ